MSFNRLNYDTGTYKQELHQSVGPGNYHLNQPPVSCTPCYPYPSTVRLQHSGDSVQKDIFMIDVDSELAGLFRKNSRNPKNKYIPCCDGTTCTSGEPCGQGVSSGCKSKEFNLKRGQRFGDQNLKHWQDCFTPAEDTRLNNPPCTLRGTGWNRWEWLCLNPQERIEMPFDWNINNRIVVKDNHRPLIPHPISPAPALPRKENLPCEETVTTCGNFTQPASVHWRSCDTMKQY